MLSLEEAKTHLPELLIQYFSKFAESSSFFDDISNALNVLPKSSITSLLDKLETNVNESNGTQKWRRLMNLRKIQWKLNYNLENTEEKIKWINLLVKDWEESLEIGTVVGFGL